MTSGPTETLVFWSYRLADDVDPLAVYASSEADERTYLRVRDGGFTFAALGEGASIEIDSADTPNRFQATARARFLLGNRVKRLDQTGLGPSPVLLGGFSFDPQHQPAADSLWAQFPRVRLTLARILIRRSATGAIWCTIVMPETSVSDAAVASSHLEVEAIETAARLWTSANDHSPATSASPPPTQRPTQVASIDSTNQVDLDPPGGALWPDESLSDTAYPVLVSDILAEIEKGHLDKVVAARAVDLDAALDAGTLAAALDQRFPGATVFAFTRDETTFLGASPEMLVCIDAQGVGTEAIAGSRPRGVDAATDAAIADEMLADPKERNEHSFVIENLRRNLTGAGATVDDTEPTRVRKLPGIQHLFTPLQARTQATSTTAIAMVGALHPSAAVCGTPTSDALAFLREHENLERGWYAAPIGWTDLEGRGEFFVALRSGLLSPGKLRLFAGAGIVAGSDPERELAETTMKLQAVLEPARSLVNQTVPVAP